MKKTYLLTLLVTLFCTLGMSAQMVYSDPSPLQQSSQGVSVYFNAAGTPLAGLEATSKVYAHTGYNDWVAAPTWGTNTEKYELTYVSPDLWKLYIGNIE